MIKMGFFDSLVFKICIIIVIVEVLVLSSIGIYYINRFSSEMETNLQNMIQAPGTLMNLGLLNYETVSDKEQMTNFVGEEILNALVIGVNKRIFHSMNPEYVGMSIDEIDALSGSLEIKTTGTTLKRGSDENGAFLTSVTPIYTVDDKTPFLFLYIRAGTSEIERQRSELVALFIAGSAVCVILTSVAIILLINSLIFKRISMLSNASNMIREGKLNFTIDKKAKESPDEIGKLALTFDSMRDAIKTQKKKLEDYSQTLEKKVKERTMELEKSKKQLEDYNVDLERFNRLAVGRELKMVELKKKIKDLENKVQ